MANITPNSVQPTPLKTQPEVSVNVVPRNPMSDWSPVFEVIQAGSSAVLMVIILLAVWARGSVSKLMDKHSLLLDTMRESITKNTLDLVKINDANVSKIKTLEHISHETEIIHNEVNQITIKVSKLNDDVSQLKDESNDQTKMLYELLTKTSQPDKPQRKKLF